MIPLCGRALWSARFFLLCRKKRFAPQRETAKPYKGEQKRSARQSRALLFPVSQSSRRRSGAKKSNPFFAAACTSRKTLCAGLGPKELASADPTADVGPAERRRLANGQPRRRAERTPPSRKRTSLFCAKFTCNISRYTRSGYGR